MAVTTLTQDLRREGGTVALVALAARAAGSVAAAVAAIASRWHDLAEAGQLGPSTETSVSRHTGGRV